MSLQARLNELKEDFKSQVDSETLSIMTSAIDELRQSNKPEHAVGEGDIAPDFTLPGLEHDGVSLTGLLAEGPVVLNFYRGVW